MIKSITRTYSTEDQQKPTIPEPDNKNDINATNKHNASANNNPNTQRTNATQDNNSTNISSTKNNEIDDDEEAPAYEGSVESTIFLLNQMIELIEEGISNWTSFVQYFLCFIFFILFSPFLVSIGVVWLSFLSFFLLH